jgi:hypothetical protein
LGDTYIHVCTLRFQFDLWCTCIINKVNSHDFTTSMNSTWVTTCENKKMLMNVRMETWKVNLRHGIHLIRFTIHLSSIIIFLVEFLWQIFSNSKKKHVCLYGGFEIYLLLYQFPSSFDTLATIDTSIVLCLLGLNWLKKHNTLVHRMRNSIIK